MRGRGHWHDVIDGCCEAGAYPRYRNHAPVSVALENESVVSGALLRATAGRIDAPAFHHSGSAGTGRPSGPAGIGAAGQSCGTVWRAA